MYKRRAQGWLKHLDFILLDAAVLLISYVLAYLVWLGGRSLMSANVSYRILAVVYVITDIMIAAVFNTMHNVLKRGYYIEFMQTLKQSLSVLVLMTLLLFSIKEGSTYSRITIYLTVVFHLILGYGTRLLWKRFLKKKGSVIVKNKMILVADEKRIREILKHKSKMEMFLYSGVVLTNRDGKGEKIEGIPVVANLERAADYICREWVDEVFVWPEQLLDSGTFDYKNYEYLIESDFEESIKKNSLSSVSDGNAGVPFGTKRYGVFDLINECREMSIPVHIYLSIPDVGEKSFVERIGGYSVLTVSSNSASPSQLALKRIVDILGGIVGSIIALGVMAVVGPIIKKQSPGPILFKQTRIGQNGKKFKIYKIRTMHMDAEMQKQSLMKQNRVVDGMMFKLDWDPRIIGNRIVKGKQITGLGEKLRKGSWDEWPQFFNVLAGQMSLVGTRPPTVDEWERYRYHHRARLAIKPGITGLWQVSGRSKITDFEEVVKLDTEYITRWSFGLDVRILLKTIKTVLKKDGAM